MDHMMRKRRILLVTQRALGWNTYAERVIAAASRIDAEFRFMDIAPRKLESIFSKRHNMSGFDRIFRRRDPIQSFEGHLGAEIRAVTSEFKPDVVHFAGHLPASAISFVSGRPNFTIALDVTRAAMERDLPRHVWTSVDISRDASLVQSAAHIFPMSSWTASSLIEDYGVDRSKISIMPPSTNVPDVRPQKIESDGKLKIVFIGGDFVRKGGDRLCKWVEGPLRDLAELHVVSGDSAARGNQPGVTFHGRVPNERLLSDILPNMDVLCKPTRSDMSSHVVVEAAAAGIPSVASGIGGIPDLIKNWETGVLLDANDSDGFINVLKRLSVDRELVRNMGENAFEWARERFDEKTNFQGLLTKIEKLAAFGGTK